MWYHIGMNVTIDRSGRVVIPAQVRLKIGLSPGTEMALEVDESSLRLTRVAPAPKLVRRGKRWVVTPSVDPKSTPSLDIPAMVEEERKRWPL
jgi:AbrB family looped-hinge helix DNA binding protein